MAPTAMAKKAKGKRQADPSETSKLLAAKISQLEQDAAGEKDQEAEIGMLTSRSPLCHFSPAAQNVHSSVRSQCRHL